ncbi:MAG: universal stress protein [Actinomycetes bacterium]
MHALIATDGSDISLEAARRGVAVLRPDRVTLLTVADTSIADDSGAGGIEGGLLSAEESERARASILGEGDRELDTTAAELGLDPAVMDRRLVEGPAGLMICRTATELHADVIVVGSHGYGLLKRVAIGSVSEYVVHHADVPVVVVRHQQDAS